MVPHVVVEVLSPSTESLDFNLKPPEYMGLASLVAYVIASQDEPMCWAWLRGKNGQFPAEPTLFKGRDIIKVSGKPQIEIPLAEVYRGILKPGRKRRAPRSL